MKNLKNELLTEAGISKTRINKLKKLSKYFEEPKCDKKFKSGTVCSILLKDGTIEDFIIEFSSNKFSHKGLDGNYYTEKDII